MSTFFDEVLARAKSDKQTIILPESNDRRTLEAAQAILAQGIANIILVGDPDEIDTASYDLSAATIIDPLTSDKREELTDILFEARKHKGMTIEQATEKAKDPVMFAVLMMKAGMADGLVSGACHATIEILSPSLRVVKTAPGASMVSSFFIMDVPDCPFGEDGMFMFADPALVIQPTAQELAEIAIASAHSFESLLGKKAHVAFLSHSTYGSAKNDDSAKVVEAVRLAREMDPSIDLDGEMQLDAAIVPEIGESKAPGSTVAGHANVLIFPDLDAANIGYKLVQRLAKAEAFGPILQGIAAPINDLSRGCSAEDIVGVVGITCLQAQARNQA